MKLLKGVCVCVMEASDHAHSDIKLLVPHTPYQGIAC